MSLFREYKKLNLSETHKEVLNYWNNNDIFQKCIENGKNRPNFTFYEGPPSANGKPGIHHVIARTIKDLFCRYKTLKGYQVNRKAGWDTHGLPVELGVEKSLGITKEDIGSKISVEEYNDACRIDVMKYKEEWEKLTNEMGYWVDMNNPYITYHNKYIESVWWLLSELHKKKMLYKGFTIQPYSPKAGTGLSTHELNQPGCYRNVKDTSATAMFQIIKDEKSEIIFDGETDVFFLAWTTTPWTLPSNTALAVGKKITYVKVRTFNMYSNKSIVIVIAKDLLKKYFTDDISISEFTGGEKLMPYEIIREYVGSDLEGINYNQLFPYKLPDDGDAFRVLLADFVTTEDGTGIVHLAPSFGSDDSLVAKKNGIGSLTLVDSQGKFTSEVTDLAGEYVKNEFYSNNDEIPKYSADVKIVIKLKEQDKLFKSEKYEHSYPHCWRTDKPILYYPMDSWFVRTTSYRDRMMDLNNTINWKPKSTGEGRFGNWLENLVDWNLSRSRFWGIPIPIWRDAKGEEEICISSIEMLKNEIDESIDAGFMTRNPLSKFEANNFSEENYNIFDLHRPYIDKIILVSKSGEKMYREEDLIDVWFDSGSMPYAQLHYPFENKGFFEKNFPADFIAEGVDQTRGWFFTLHAISTILFDSIAYKNVISNGLVLDKDGNKMSKRLGNAIDPFYILDKFGADSTRWYMMSNAQPWDNLKFDLSGIEEVQRKFFGTLFNTYSFFALYANIDNFKYNEADLPVEEMNEIDRWIISELNSLIIKVENSYEDYEPTRTSRLIQEFVINKLSNWYVRLSRRRFWKGVYNQDKISAYQTLYQCLEKISIISSPISPFFMERLFQDLNFITNRIKVDSVHHSSFPCSDTGKIDLELERRMDIAQKITSLVLSLRKREKIRVRQPLQKIIIPVKSIKMRSQIEKVKNILLSELNIKDIEFINPDSKILIKKIKPNFKSLGPKYGKNMKLIANSVNNFTIEDIKKIEIDGEYRINEEIIISLNDVEIFFIDIPGYKVVSQDNLTVALDITINEELKYEGISREFINRIQNIRKDSGFDVMDKISVFVEKNELIEKAINNNLSYICGETLADNIEIVNDIDKNFHTVELIDNLSVNMIIKKI